MKCEINMDVDESLHLVDDADRRPSIQYTLDYYISIASYARMYEERLGIPFPSDT